MAEPTPIVIPHSGVVESVYIIEWLKGAGDHVEEGEEVVLIETEKAEGAIEAPASGTLEIMIDADPENDVEVDVGTTIGRVLP
jgi:pyruvate/2-oxoglutarate dehydrogenase complex dihydrolipoamide acyltransferase (E2) component